MMADKLSRHLSHQIAYESDRPVPTQLYYRFWVGFKKPELPVEKFDEVIRDRFVRATIKTGEAGGLQLSQRILKKIFCGGLDSLE